jgi:N4-gp56 family major capsid protein
MSGTSYGVNDALAVKLWSKKLFQEALKTCWMAKFIGSGSDSIIQIKSDTGKGAGDKVTVGLRMQLTGDGVQGDGTLEGNEEALTTYSDALYIDQLRHAVRSAGKMSEQRVPFSVREEAMKGLKDWWAARIDLWAFNQLCGNTVQTDTRYTGNQAAIAPDANHRVFTVGSADETVQADSTKIFTLSVIDKCVEKAKTATVPVRPVMINGEEKYVMFLHPYQVYDMRTSSSTGQWLDIQKAAMAGSKASSSPIYTGALGEYNGVVLHESTRVQLGVHSSTGAAQSAVRRAVFCGAQAAMIGYGQKNQDGEMTWVEELFDYGNQLGVSAGLIGGLKKTVFNSADFGVITASTYAAAH